MIAHTQEETTIDLTVDTPTPTTAQGRTQPRWRIPGDVVQRTCENLPDDIRREFKWLNGYARQRDLSQTELGNLLLQPNGKPYSSDSIYQALTGRRNDNEGSLKNLATAIAALRRRVDETSSRTDRSAFVETSLTKRIWATCRTALVRHKLCFIFGDSQIGKTTALAEYARRHNHGETIIVRMPTRGNYCDFIWELARTLGISPHTNRQDLRRRLIESFDDRTLLIVDEAHECLRTNPNDPHHTLNFLREIYDRRKCGLVLCGTNVLKLGLRSSKVLKQLWLRGYRPLQLPPAPSQANLAAFATAYGLQPAADRTVRVEIETIDDSGRTTTARREHNPLKLQTDTIRDFGLGRWLNLLEDAADAAADAHKPISWGRVIAAHYTALELETGF